MYTQSRTGQEVDIYMSTGNKGLEMQGICTTEYDPAVRRNEALTQLKPWMKVKIKLGNES